LLRDKVKRLKKDVAGHKVCHEEKALSREGALAKFAGAFQVARLPLPKFGKGASVSAMFDEVDLAIERFEKEAKKNPGAKDATDKEVTMKSIANPSRETAKKNPGAKEPS